MKIYWLIAYSELRFVQAPTSLQLLNRLKSLLSCRRPAFEKTELLRRNYPSRARDLGIEGDAVVRVLVNPNGRVRPLAVVSEDYEGFGDACRQTLRQGPQWEAPRDRQGEAVATRVNFRCTFTIR